MNTVITDQELKRREALHRQFIDEIAALKDQLVHLVVFDLSGRSFAIEISKIHEVVKTPAITPMPKMPSYIPGIGKIRGNSILLLDLSGKLGMENPETLSGRMEYTVVVSSGRFTIGILTPTVPTTKKISGSHIQPTGIDLAGTPEDETYIKGLIHDEDQQHFFIDIDELIEGDRMTARTQ